MCFLFSLVNGRQYRRESSVLPRSLSAFISEPGVCRMFRKGKQSFTGENFNAQAKEPRVWKTDSSNYSVPSLSVKKSGLFCV